MAIYYVRSGATGLNNGTNWTDAYTAFASAVTAATTNGDFIYVAHDHAEDLGADTTYTFGANVIVLCVNTGTGALTTGGRIGHTTSNRSISLGGAFKIFMYGLKLQIAGTLVDSININTTTGGHFELNTCDLVLTNTNGSSRISCGVNNASAATFTKFKNCLFSFGATTQQVLFRQHVVIVGGSVDSAGSAPATLFDSGGAGCWLEAYGWNLSHVTGTLVEDGVGMTSAYTLTQCSLGSGVVPFAAQSVANRASGFILLLDCAAGDQHYHIAHYDALGSTTVDTGIYANDGAQYDGTNRASWKITTTAAASYWTPYISPWFTKYHAAAASVTPYVEVLRDGSTTAYTDEDLAVEIAAKVTSGSTRATIHSDRMAPLGTPANQAAGVGTGGWTGEAASAWSGKLDSGSAFTPAEIGDIAARIIFSKASSVVYVDPRIRGL